jgi:hypothetical protein
MGPLDAVLTRPEWEARRRCHVCLRPAARGVTAPRPVTTTLRMAFPESDSWDYYAEKFVDRVLVVMLLDERA